MKQTKKLIAFALLAACGCSSLAPDTRGQRTEIVAVGIPAIAWISHSTQTADHAGGDTNGVAQSNAQSVSVPITAAK